MWIKKKLNLMEEGGSLELQPWLNLKEKTWSKGSWHGALMAITNKWDAPNWQNWIGE